MTRCAGLLCATLLCSLALGCAGSPLHPPPSGTVAALELEAFADFVLAVHPDAERFVSRATFQAVVRGEASRLRAQELPEELDVGLAFQRVVAALHDSHMAVAQPAFQPGRDVSLLPLVVELIADEVLVDASVDDQPVGTTLEAIDGRDLAGILAALEPLAIYEGSNAAARVRVLARDFVPLYHVAFGMRASYALRLRLPDGSVSTVQVAGVERESFGALARRRHSLAMRGRAADATDTLPSVYSVDALTQVVRLPSFGNADQEAVATRLSEVVALVAQTPQLVLDLRGNEGGYRTYGIALLNHLSDRPYAQWRRTSVRVRSIPAVFRDRVEPLYGTSLALLRAYPSHVVDGAHWLEGDPLADRMLPAQPRLPADLVVFVDGLTNSAANELLLALRVVRPDAVIVGEEVGGECERHVGELPVAYVTPVYGVAVALSLIRIEHVTVPGCERGHGLRPDVPVVYTRDDFISGADPYVRALGTIW